jgi:hypothetical protein
MAANRMGCRNSSQFAGLHFVDVAPHPGFSGLNRPDEWMFCRVEVLCRVLILGRVTTTDMATTQAQTEMYPGIPRLYALFAYMFVGLPDFNLVKVATLISHRLLRTLRSSGQVTSVT